MAGIAWRMAIAIVLHGFALVIGFRYGWGWALLTGASLSSLWCWGVLCPKSQWFGPMRCRRDDNRMLITIDDGPDPRDTPAMLDLLDERGVKAIFFVIGEKVREYPELAREIVKRGHELGNHTLTHPQATFWCASPWRTRREIAGCNRAIEEVTGVKPTWFRAPVGHRNFFTHPIASELGLELMAWTRRGYDAVSTDTRKILSQLLESNQPGDIFLIHEGTPIALEVLRGVLDGIDAQGCNSSPSIQ
jgi:peptidoglycan/xylan/chitin deacetylase (PgdA/CDA1 family)